MKQDKGGTFANGPDRPQSTILGELNGEHWSKRI